MSEAVDRGDAGTLMAAWGQIAPHTLGSTAARDLGLLAIEHHLCTISGECGEKTCREVASQQS